MAPSPTSRWPRSASRRASRRRQCQRGRGQRTIPVKRGAMALVAALLLARRRGGRGQIGKAPAPVAGPRAPAERPTLALLTSLPLLFGEQFSISRRRVGGADAGSSSATMSFRSGSPMAPASTASRLLLMAHPRAQPAEVLVELDRWVRGGGRVVAARRSQARLAQRAAARRPAAAAAGLCRYRTAWCIGG